MDKEDVVHRHNGALLSHKEEWNYAICSNMNGPGDYHTDLEIILLSKVSQAEKG